jgi:hypothetical protein
MKRNSGIIGSKRAVTTIAANGIFDTFDQFTNSSNWPKSVSYIGTFPISGTVLENSVNNVSFTTTGISVNTTLYWTILHGTSTNADFNGSVDFGSFTQFASNQQGNFSYNLTFTGNTAKSPKTFQIQIRTGSTAGPVVYTSGVFTIPTIGVSQLYWSPSSVNEGNSSYLYLQLTNCGTWSSWTFNITYSGSAVSADTTGLYSTTLRNPGSFTSGLDYQIVADITTEGTETLIAQLSYNGFNIGSPQTLTINDTSQALTGTITPSTTNITEGNGVTFNVSVSGTFSGTLYYTINNVTGTMSGADFTDGLLSGSFTVTNSSGLFVKTLVADGSAEGEAFSVSLRSGSTSGSVLSTTSTITVTDAAAPAVTWTNPVIISNGFNATTAAGIVNNYYRRYIVMFSYSVEEMQALLGTSNVTIYGLRYFVNSAPTYQPYPNHAVGMKNGSLGITTNPGSGGYSIVSLPKSESFTASSYKEIIFDTPFVWVASGGLSIAVAWGQSPSNYSSTGTSRAGNGTIFYNRTDAAGAYSINTDTAGQVLANNRPVVEFKITA